jgi:hypothetical protein
VGPSHRCLCGAARRDHDDAPGKKGRGPALPRCPGGGGGDFTYVPNTPEEIGEAWLAKRANFDAAAWRPKCRCGHTSDAHRGGARGARKCRSCACYTFEGDWACLVCDGRHEDHETVAESGGERAQAGRTVGDAFRPLADVDPEFSEMVFGERGQVPRVEPGRNAVGVTQFQVGDGAPRAGARMREVGAPPAGARGGGGGDPFAAPTVACPNCQTPYRTATSSFCSQCGMKRPGK